MYWMEPEQVRAMSGDLDRAAAEVESVVKELTAALGGTNWVGDDRDRFEQDWQSAHVARLNEAATALREAANAARRNADDQTRISRS